MPCHMYDGSNDNVVISWYRAKCDVVINKERKCKSKQGRPLACAEMEKLYIAYMSTSLLTEVAISYIYKYKRTLCSDKGTNDE